MPQLFEGFCIDYNKSLINRFLMGLTELLLEPSLTFKILTLFMNLITCKSFVLVFLLLYNHIFSVSSLHFLC
ncbi:hypothetical protein HID58_056634 [Brassica napus]|uniref:Uncharacterized protein n=2 Tax=Brassica TaxID=3705 RepID=A0ABQ8AQD2_BRANA|nr:hypothetical protein HID58_056634 [Brassica napus]VDC99016.1 unnamed protein product [Brassica oleracea]